MSSDKTWLWVAFRFLVLLMSAGIFGYHVLAQAGMCGAFDGGPQPGEETFCDRDALQLLLSAIVAGVFLLGGMVTARTHHYAPGVLGCGLALLIGVTVPFEFVSPVCEGVYGTDTRAERLAALEARVKLVGESEKDVCRRIGSPNRVDGNAWKYSAGSPRNVDRGDLIVEFEAGKVRATRFDSVR